MDHGQAIRIDFCKFGKLISLDFMVYLWVLLMCENGFWVEILMDLGDD